MWPEGHGVRKDSGTESWVVVAEGTTSPRRHLERDLEEHLTGTKQSFPEKRALWARPRQAELQQQPTTRTQWLHSRHTPVQVTKPASAL